MIVCGQCGERNPSDAQFCGSCGAFLEWEGAQVDAAPGASVPASGGSAPVATSAVGSPPVGSPPVGSPPVGSPPVGSPPVGSVPVASSGPAVRAAEPAATAAEPAVVQPGEQQVRRRVQAPPDDRPAAPGEVVCGSCGAGNDPQRRFCRRCGTALTAGAVTGRLSWWRRLWGRLAGRRVYQAGDRRRRAQPARFPGWVLVIVVVLLLCFAALGPGRPAINWAVTEVEDRTSTAAPVTPTAVRASVSASGHGPEQLVDGAKNRYWAAPSAKAVGAWVEVDLPRPARLLDLIVTTGVSSDKKEFLTQGRPQDVEVAVTDRSGHVTTSAIHLLDQPDPQRFGVKVSDAVRVRLTVRSTYGVPPAGLVAIAEVELFTR
jgi:ribosomal protein L40E